MNAPENAKIASLWTGKRFYIAVLLFFNLFINYIDRVNLSIAAPAIAKDFKWDPAMMGVVFSAFLWTYAICLVPIGWLVDKFGTRRVNAASVAIWSAGAMLTGAVTNLGNMIAARLALGSGEAASWPNAGKVVREWFPADERALAMSVANAGSYAGPAIMSPIIAWIVLQTSWRWSFVILGATGIIWVFVWLKMFRGPAECSWLPAAERDYILARTDDRSGAKRAAEVPKGAVLRLLSRRTMWGIFLTQGCCIYTMYLYLTWLPSYLVKARGMQLMKASLFNAVPYLVAVVLGIYFGRLSDKILTPQALLQGKRRTLLIVFMLLSSTVLLVTVTKNEWLALLLISWSLSCISTASVLNNALANDLVENPNMVGTTVGILILGGNTFGMSAPIITGYIVKATGSFDSAFFLAGGLLIVGALISFTMTKRPLKFQEDELTMKSSV
jgi:ACS family glucarate transporter-like MFS transporter